MTDPATEIAPLTKSVTVSVPVERAFSLFTDEIASWWPLETHSISRERAETCVFEGREGGRIFERTTDGEEHRWGTVLVWEPPTHVVYTWHPSRAEETAQKVEMWFAHEEEGTRVSIEHRGWERLGEQAHEAIETYRGGWDYVLGKCYVARAEAGR